MKIELTIEVGPALLAAIERLIRAINADSSQPYPTPTTEQPLATGGPAPGSNQPKQRKQA